MTTSTQTDFELFIFVNLSFKQRQILPFCYFNRTILNKFVALFGWPFGLQVGSKIKLHQSSIDVISRNLVSSLTNRLVYYSKIEVVFRKLGFIFS